MEKSVEEKVRIATLKYLQDGRPLWDIPHTLAAVYWMKKLLIKERGNKKILITTIYLHDIGYKDLFKNLKCDEKNANSREIKTAHQKFGVTYAKKILSDTKDFTSREIKRITELIAIHDNIEDIHTKEHQLVFEADSLGQIDTKRIKSTFNRKDKQKFIKDFENKRASRFKTKTGKIFLKKLLKEAKKLYI
jgi:hypothetical protein